MFMFVSGYIFTCELVAIAIATAILIRQKIDDYLVEEE